MTMGLSKLVGTLVLVLLALANDGMASERFADQNLFPASEAPFLNGISSADPLEDRVLIWTRITPENSTVLNTTVNWALWDPEDVAQNVTNPLVQGSILAEREDDFAITVDVTGLQPNKYYFYQFSDEEGNLSMLGRTKTAVPPGQPFTAATVSCTSIWNGYMNFYRHMANNDAIDVIIHLGDYIYPQTGDEERFPKGMCAHEWWNRAQKGVGGVSSENENPYVASLVDEFDCENGSEVDQYRWVYHYYSLDPDFRLARASHPFIVIQDDHDQEHDTAELKGALKAALEWLPMRHTIDIRNNTEFLNTSRHFRYGDCDFVALDTRLMRDETGLLGANQSAWLDQVLQNSSGKWRMFGTSKQFMPFTLNALPQAANLYLGLVWFFLLIFLAICVGTTFIVWRKKNMISAAAVAVKDDEESDTHKDKDVDKSAFKLTRVNLVRSQKESSKIAKLCNFCGLLAFLGFTLLWIVGAIIGQKELNPDELMYLDGAPDGWEGRPESRQQFYDQLKAQDKTTNNIWITGDMHMCMFNDAVEFDYETKDLLSYDPDGSSHKTLGVEFLSSSGSRANLDERATSITNLDVESPLNQFLARFVTTLLSRANPWFRHFNPIDHGYGILDFQDNHVAVSFLAFPIKSKVDQPKIDKTMFLKHTHSKWSDEL